MFTIAEGTGNTTITGDLTITGGNITNAITCDSTLTVTGASQLNSTLAVTGLVTATSGIKLSNNINIWFFVETRRAKRFYIRFVSSNINNND